MTLQQLMSPIRRAIDDFNMISDGDKIAVGLSGGKDSIALVSALAGLRRFYPKKFDIVAIRIDMGLDYDEKEKEELKKYLESINVEYFEVKTEIGQVVFEIKKESSPCSLCSNMRRGALNSSAKEKGCNKVALGHHGDDLIETFCLSMMYEGRLSTFQPITKLERADLEVIRPMIYVRERDVVSFAKDKPILHNPCVMDKHTKREYVKNLLSEIRKEIPFVNDNILNALTHPERNNLIKKNLDKNKVEKE